MAQKREKEETELKVPETLTLCAPSIASTNSKISGSDEHRSSAPDRSDLKTGVVVDSRLSSASSPERPDLQQKIRAPTAEAPISVSDENRSASTNTTELKTGAVVETRMSSGSSPKRPDLNQDESSKVKRREINRCAGCRRKVGLIGFRCRCGELFCSDHRYSDRHDCSYDYKAAGREAIARENPVVRAAKILKV